MNFKIFDENKESYIIGDLLNMPKFFAGWNSNPHNNEYMYNLFTPFYISNADYLLFPII